ncbi:sensor histidine kinase [Croceibacterium ferulae]|uniref:sensor histidine kinase n=1 Tax=Croceibacterium ferulae TaxID=1854641 RepID=UPI000EB59142|nr:histidine kinase [Croceibacterium ferulae]
MDRATIAEDPAPHGGVPFRTVLASVLGLWLCYFLLSTIRAHLMDFGFAEETLWRRALACGLGVAITLALWLVLRLFDHRPLPVKIVAALLLSLPVSVALAQSNRLVFQSLEERVFTREAERRGFTINKVPSGDLLVDIPAMPALPELPAPPASPGAGPPALPVPPAAPLPPIAGAGQTITLPAGTLRGDPWHYLVEVVFSRYFMMLAWCALYLALLTGVAARAAERRESAYRRAARAAELKSLRYQVNPHFLFNTLNSLSALVLTGRTSDAERMIGTMSTFYRHSLADDPTGDVPLRQELELQRLYLDIEAVRFPHRLRTRYELPAELEGVCVPGMILQPLVENSILHALAPTVQPVTITIAARAEGDRLLVEVSDDGPGRSEDGGAGSAPAHRGFGIGLANVRDRLAARFGTAAQVTSGPRPGGGYCTRLDLPLRGQDMGD